MRRLCSFAGQRKGQQAHSVRLPGSQPALASADLAAYDPLHRAPGAALQRPQANHAAPSAHPSSAEARSLASTRAVEARCGAAVNDSTMHGTVPALLHELQTEQQRMRSKFEEHMDALSHIEGRFQREAVSARQQQAAAVLELQRVHELLASSAALRSPVAAVAPSAEPRHDDEACALAAVATHVLPPGINYIPDNPDDVHLAEDALRELRFSVEEEPGHGLPS